MKKLSISISIVLLATSCDSPSEPEDELMIPDSSEICNNQYSNIDGTLISCGENCSESDGDCYHLNDINALEAFQQTFEPLNNLTLLEIGIQEWENGRLILLNLSNSELIGEIPMQIGYLSALQSLYLNDNQISSIPDEICYLDLNNLTLANNQFCVGHYFPDCINNYVSCDTCFDYDGNLYNTVKIGSQIWMAKNLMVTHYNNGDVIPTGFNNTEWVQLDETETGAYAVYPVDDDNASQETCGNDCSEVYGNLYNWFAVDDDRGICPEGYHIPSNDEFKELEKVLGISEEEVNIFGYRGTNVGSKLAGNAELWEVGELIQNSNFGILGYNARPAGLRYNDGQNMDGHYLSLGKYSIFWTSTRTSVLSSAYSRYILSDSSKIAMYASNLKRGHSIRCLQD